MSDSYCNKTPASLQTTSMPVLLTIVCLKVNLLLSMLEDFLIELDS